MNDLHIYFCDFWKDFNKESNIFVSALSENFQVFIDEHASSNTDLIIYSCFGKEYLRYPFNKKLFYSGENDYPNFNECDYALSHVVIDGFDRYMRLPLWVLYEYYSKDKFVENPNYDDSYFDRKFCGSVVSNKFFVWPLRDKVLYKISEYKLVDNGGRLYNNVGEPVDDKLKFLNDYKFSIASENSDVEGYVTEKIYEAFKANTIPIYLGTNYVINDFDKDAFINVNDFKSFTDLLSRIKEIDETKDLYMEILNHSRSVQNNTYKDFYNRLVEFMKHVIDGKKFNHLYGKMGTNWKSAVNLAYNK
jgi:alpha(1,3/1,4) fucosyltransferase